MDTLSTLTTPPALRAILAELRREIGEQCPDLAVRVTYAPVQHIDAFIEVYADPAPTRNWFCRPTPAAPCRRSANWRKRASLWTTPRCTRWPCCSTSRAPAAPHRLLSAPRAPEGPGNPSTQLLGGGAS